MKKILDWAIYLIVTGIIIIVMLPFQEYLIDHFSPKRNYQRGLQAGMENAEYYCNSFNSDYIGSLDYIKKHDQRFYQELVGNEE